MASTKQQLENEAYYDRIISASLKIGFVALLFILSFLILKPFLVMVVWGIIIAIGIYPLFRKLSALFGNRSSAQLSLIFIRRLESKG